MSKGIVLRDHDAVIERRAKGAGLKVVISDGYDVPFDKTLIVEPEIRVPFDLLPAAWHFLDRWDAAVPLWRYGITASDIGTAEERRATKVVIRDLRVLLHSTELLFVRGNDAGRALMDAWEQETVGGHDARLAFLRAVYHVKPRLCVLPRTWLADVRDSYKRVTSGRGVRSPNAENPLVTVELEPGRLVKCHAGDEQRVREMFERQRGAR